MFSGGFLFFTIFENHQSIIESENIVDIDTFVKFHGKPKKIGAWRLVITIIFAIVSIIIAIMIILIIMIIIIVRANLRKIAAHNEREEQGLETWRMAVTEFADLTEEVQNYFVLQNVSDPIS